MHSTGEFCFELHYIRSWDIINRHLRYFSKTSTFYQNDSAIRNNADVSYKDVIITFCLRMFIKEAGELKDIQIFGNNYR
jgi:hypothetical protein